MNVRRPRRSNARAVKAIYFELNHLFGLRQKHNARCTGQPANQPAKRTILVSNRDESPVGRLPSYPISEVSECHGFIFRGNRDASGVQFSRRFLTKFQL